MKNSILVYTSIAPDLSLPSGVFVLSQKFQPQPTACSTISACKSLSAGDENVTVAPIFHARNSIIPT